MSHDEHTLLSSYDDWHKKPFDLNAFNTDPNTITKVSSLNNNADTLLASLQSLEAQKREPAHAEDGMVRLISEKHKRDELDIDNNDGYDADEEDGYDTDDTSVYNAEELQTTARGQNEAEADSAKDYKSELLLGDAPTIDKNWGYKDPQTGKAWSDNEKTGHGKRATVIICALAAGGFSVLPILMSATSLAVLPAIFAVIAIGVGADMLRKHMKNKKKEKSHKKPSLFKKQGASQQPRAKTPSSSAKHE